MTPCSSKKKITRRMLGVSTVVLTCLSLLFVCVGEAQSAARGFHYDLLSVVFPSERDGWACGRWGTILRTADGGKTWTKQQTGTLDMLTSVNFVDAKNGWAVGDRGTILHTADGGQTWEKQKSPTEILLMSVQFVSPAKGWAVGEKTTILHTSDGGKTWAVQFKDVDFILRSVSFCDEQHGWACGEYGHIYGTSNGGATWKKQAGRYGISQDTGDIEADDYLFRIQAVDPRTAWAVGIDGLVVKSTDGGAHWQKMKNGFPGSHLFGLAYAGGTIAICGRGLLAYGSADAGTLKRAKVEPSIEYGWMNSVRPRGKTGFAAVGKAGWIYLSDDAGASWRKIDY